MYCIGPIPTLETASLTLNNKPIDCLLNPMYVNYNKAQQVIMLKRCEGGCIKSLEGDVQN